MGYATIKDNQNSLAPMILGPMKNLTLCPPLLCFVVIVCLQNQSCFVNAQEKSEPTSTSDEKGFSKLFNGKDLDGWVRVNTDKSTWSVKDQMLICTGKPIGELRTTKMYQNFILEVEWRHMKPAGNAGIFVWADDITARGVPFHRGIEVQVLENAYGNTRGYTTHGDIFPIHGAKMKPVNGRGGSRAFPTENRSNPSPEWNHYRIECNQGEISLAVNGKKVTEGKNCSPSKGYICIESEGGVVHYRNMKIKELPDTEVDAKDTATANRDFRTLYNGIHLNNWNTEGDWKTNDWVLSSPGKGKLTTKESFEDFGFVFDIRLKTDTTTSIGFGKGCEIQIDSKSQSKWKLGKGWNRFEGEVNGAVLTMRVNGKEVESLNLKKKITGPISFETKGPVDFANIFVRQLPKK